MQKLHKIIPHITIPEQLYKIISKHGNRMLEKEAFMRIVIVIYENEITTFFSKIYALVMIDNHNRILTIEEIYNLFVSAIIEYVKVNIRGYFSLAVNDKTYKIFSEDPTNIFMRNLVDKAGKLRPFLKLEYGKNPIEPMTETLLCSLTEAILLEEYDYDEIKQKLPEERVIIPGHVRVVSALASIPAVPKNNQLQTIQLKRRASEVETTKQ